MVKFDFPVNTSKSELSGRRSKVTATINATHCEIHKKTTWDIRKKVCTSIKR